MKILHLIKTDTILKERWKYFLSNNITNTAILIHDGIYITELNGIETYACKDDIKARNWTSPFPSINYDKIVEKILNSDKVINW